MFWNPSIEISNGATVMIYIDYFIFWKWDIALFSNYQSDSYSILLQKLAKLFSNKANMEISHFDGIYDVTHSKRFLLKSGLWLAFTIFKKWSGLCTKISNFWCYIIMHRHKIVTFFMHNMSKTEKLFHLFLYLHWFSYIPPCFKEAQYF